MLTVDRLKAVLNYDPERGLFTWRHSRIGRGCRAGATAGRPNERGYLRLGIDGVRYKAHQLAWLYMTGEWPELQIDHRNNDKSDNRWSNLRLATGSQNQANRGLQRNNTSGFKGVSARRGKFAAYIKRDGKKHTLGSFDTAEEAHAAYVAAAPLFHGEFARVG